MNQIKLVVFDIDGVLTDGSIIVDTNGNEQKKINIKDIDAVYELKRRGLLLVAITGENTQIVRYFEKRLPWDRFYLGNKDKLKTLKAIADEMQLCAGQICYIGDGKYDVEPLSWAGLSITPRDAIADAKQAADVVLQNRGGEGCVWEMLDVLDAYNHPAKPEHYFYARLREHTLLFRSMASDTALMGKTMSAAEKLFSGIADGKQIFLCGNGGSAADAQHIATEFIGRFYKERPALNAEALSVNTSTLTAIGNDYGFERVFVRQLEAKAKKGDILVGISTSGTSKNVLEALRYGHKNHLTTILLMGDHDSSEMDEICDYVLKVPSSVTPRVQEAHIFLGHLMAEYVEHRLFGSD